MSTTFLPTELVARLRAVDREVVGSALVDTPAHLDQLTDDIRRRGIQTPLSLGWNEHFAHHGGRPIRQVRAHHACFLVRRSPLGPPGGSVRLC